MSGCDAVVDRQRRGGDAVIGGERGGGAVIGGGVAVLVR